MEWNLLSVCRSKMQKSTIIFLFYLRFYPFKEINSFAMGFFFLEQSTSK